MTVADPEIVELDKLDSDWAIACDYVSSGGRKNTTLHVASGGAAGNSPAEWAQHVRCPSCQHTAVLLICTCCKDFIMATPDGVECARCGDITTPYRHFVVRYEPIQKRGAA